MKISIIAFTDNGMEIAWILSNSLEGDLDINRCKSGALSDWTEEHFSSSDALVFVGAMGIAVRAIAPFVKTKTNDPAVVVVDERGQFSIPVLSGHIGGANELANKIANILDAIPVISTATDINNVFAIDTWAKSQGLKILNPENIKSVSSKLLKGEEVHIKSEFSIVGDLPQNVFINDLNELKDYDVVIDYKNYDDEFNAENILFLIPQVITLGLGCRKDVDFEKIENSVLSLLKVENIHILALKAISSIDRKAREKGIIEFARKYALPFKTYSADDLNALDGDFTKSEFVKSVVDVDNVCERSAILESNGTLLCKKKASDGVTTALAIKEPALHW